MQRSKPRQMLLSWLSNDFASRQVIPRNYETQFETPVRLALRRVLRTIASLQAAVFRGVASMSINPEYDGTVTLRPYPNGAGSEPAAVATNYAPPAAPAA